MAPEIYWPEKFYPANQDETNLIAEAEAVNVFFITEVFGGGFIVSRQILLAHANGGSSSSSSYLEDEPFPLDERYFPVEYDDAGTQTITWDNRNWLTFSYDDMTNLIDMRDGSNAGKVICSFQKSNSLLIDVYSTASYLTFGGIGWSFWDSQENDPVHLDYDPTT